MILVGASSRPHFIVSLLGNQKTVDLACWAGAYKVAEHRRTLDENLGAGLYGPAVGVALNDELVERLLVARFHDHHDLFEVGLIPAADERFPDLAAFPRGWEIERISGSGEQACDR